ncbi:MAG: bifunctional (p)ppGpp synthetase/guanosine-3',5'-bis(diphosphate) 3'-pyrophosphohydrolase [Treponema sp.]|uniref:RelA/SpoT family protein n=1 Tax=Treponema sp. TaxID=166 RepID=UPI001E05B82F|nr:RelA/SpoT family protein [Treponema sp.]MBS7242550.1 bifunctional (p)ppGpp synthetase/guanosine-3',5'-bis(diphosphate) 3'-pyrophosphohydrolase [Treponema sp.]
MSELKGIEQTETDPEVLISAFLKDFSDVYNEEDEKKISRAWNYLIGKTAELKRNCGKPYYVHPLRVARVLAEKHLGADTIVAGLFHNILDVDNDCLPEIEKLFGKDIATICNGTAKITSLKIKSDTIQQADSIRKMLFAMVDDIRVILVKLADRLDRMRNLKFVSPESQKAVAKEVIDIWCPLASRLGMADIKSEMEDLSLKYSNPDVFQQIKSIVAQKKQERADYLNNAVKKIYTATEKAGVSVTISSRAKHFYSIYQKMKKRNKDAGELYDLLALRIICNTNAECYTLIGIVHSLFKPMDGRFKDYIAMPKANGYQSLHTTVICEGKPLEIQIRTQDMHNIAEHGVASHWLYKKGTNRDLVKAEDLSIINQLRALRNEDLSNESFFKELKSELLGDSIYVFTPMGDVKELPQGANAIDFAYMIHSSIGEKIVGAKADGKIIPLTQPLQNTQIIDILTNPQAHPTQSQLNAVKTSRARSRINAWLTANDPTYIDKEAQEKRDAEILANTIYSKKVAEEKRKKAKEKKKDSTEYSGKIRVDDLTNYLVTVAKCCSPVPGDPIVGYISRSRGITVHRADCLTFLRIPDIERRKVSVEWDTSEKKTNEKEVKIKEQLQEKNRQKQKEKNQYKKQR